MKNLQRNFVDLIRRVNGFKNSGVENWKGEILIIIHIYRCRVIILHWQRMDDRREKWMYP